MPARDRGLPPGDGTGEPFEFEHAAGVVVLVEGGEPLACLFEPRRDLPYDARMATRLTGWAAIDFARGNGATLSVHATSGEPARDDVSVEEAETIATRRPEQVYVDFDEPDHDGSADA
jgi:hypothetical protein